MKWQSLRLEAQTAGSEYGEDTLRVAELLEKMSVNSGGTDRPAVVWFYSPEDVQVNEGCDQKIFANEQVGLALQMVNCYRVDVDSIRNETIREEYARDLPAFHFFDPAGEELARLSGKRANSLSGFSSLLTKLWSKSFTVALKSYTKEMARILNRLDKITAEKQILDADLARLAERPNPRKQAKLDRELEEIEKESADLLADETELKESIALRSEYAGEEAVRNSR